MFPSAKKSRNQQPPLRLYASSPSAGVAVAFAFNTSSAGMVLASTPPPSPSSLTSALRRQLFHPEQPISGNNHSPSANDERRCRTQCPPEPVTAVETTTDPATGEQRATSHGSTTVALSSAAPLPHQNTTPPPYSPCETLCTTAARPLIIVTIFSSHRCTTIDAVPPPNRQVPALIHHYTHRLPFSAFNSLDLIQIGRRELREG